MINEPVINVTVAHIPMTKEIYDELQEALNELDLAFGGIKRTPTAESVNARRWLHYRWLLEQAGNGQSVDNKVISE